MNQAIDVTTAGTAKLIILFLRREKRPAVFAGTLRARWFVG